MIITSIPRFLLSESNDLLQSLAISLERVIREDKAVGKEHAVAIIKNLTSTSEKSTFMIEFASRKFQSVLVDVIKEQTYLSMSSKKESTRMFMETASSIENNIEIVDLLISLGDLVKEKELLGLESLKLLSEVLSNIGNCVLFTEYYLDLLPPIVSILKRNQLDIDTMAYDNCLKILISLSKVYESRVLISNPSLEVLDTLSNIIFNNSNGNRKKALEIVFNVYVVDHSSPLIRSPPIGLIRSLVNVVSIDNENQLKALETICNMSVSTNYRKVLAMSSVGLIEQLVYIIKTDKGRLRLEAFVIVGNLLSYQENIKKLTLPHLGLIEILNKWKRSYDENNLNEEENSIGSSSSLPLYIEQMILSLEANSYNSELPSLVQKLSLSLNRNKENINQ